MKIERALSDIAEIHSCLARISHYRGYRAVPVGLSGLAGLVAALLQPLFVQAGHSQRFVYYWVIVAALVIVFAGGGIVIRYFFASDHAERRKTIAVVAQSVSCLVAGLILTLGFLVSGNERVLAFLPPVWAFVYGVGVFASRPFLPRMIGWVGLHYFVAGAIMLRFSVAGVLSAWSMGLTFGIGQLLAGGILYWNLERKQR